MLKILLEKHRKVLTEDKRKEFEVRGHYAAYGKGVEEDKRISKVRRIDLRYVDL